MSNVQTVYFKDFINYNKRLGKVIISGDEGTGKTLLLTMIANGKMLHGLQDCWKSYKQVDEYNKLGFNFSKNYEHLCFANFDINCSGTNIPNRKVYRCNPYRLGLFDKLFKTDFFPPYSLFCITEAYNIFNAYLYDKFRDSFKGFIKTCRQGKYDFVLDTQYFGDICTIFRRITNRFIYLEREVEMIENKEGVVVGHKLHVIEWHSNRDVEYFERTTKKQNCKEYDLIIDKCLFKNYDTEFCKYLHLLGRENQDFLIEHFKTIENIEDLDNFGEKFGTIAPEGFFLTNKIKKENKQLSEDNSDDSISF